jgi:hypothetical protein
MKIHAAALIFCLCVISSFAYPQTAVPDLSGTWKLNATKTGWDGVKSLEWRIKQTGNNIAVEIIADGTTNRLVYVVDGKPRLATVDPESKIKVVAQASWQGKELVLVSRFEDESLPELTSRFSLSTDGKVLSVRRVMGDRDITFVFEKQQARNP